ncbi:tetratricopeptide repeat protein [Spongiimicrobium sp. 2-473A-2-J]|uniref:tetratricopeptide repeat protein n=1 Tax=Eudoraea algarum TaxID=3417568 RepID=UPI003D35BC2E
MERTNFNIYLFKALDAYPYNLEEAIEALNYALSYDAKNVQALYLMGKIYTEQLGEFETAKSCFSEALASGLDWPKIYPAYIRTLVLNEDYEEAQKLLDFAIVRKATDKGALYFYQGLLKEVQGEFKEAIKAYKQAKRHGLNNEFIRRVEEEISRVKGKFGKKKSKNKKKRKEEKSKNRS